MWHPVRSSRHSAPGTRYSEGFTLIELLVVLAIAGLLMAVVPPLLSNALPGLQLKGTARQLADGMRMARVHAISRREEVTLVVDVDRRTIRVPGRSNPIHVPEDLKIELETALQELEDENRGRIRFYPDGSSTGGRVTLSYGGSGYRVDVEWLTGRVHLTAESPNA